MATTKSKIKTFEQACAKLKLSKTLPVFPAMSKQEAAALTAHYKLIIIAKALNDGWEPNWNDGSTKYYPYFEVEASDKVPSGFGFSYANCDLWRTGTHVGSRLCFRSSELALYAAKQFEKLYIEYFLIKH